MAKWDLLLSSHFSILLLEYLVFSLKKTEKKNAKTSYFMARIHYHFLNLSEAHDLMTELLQESQNWSSPHTPAPLPTNFGLCPFSLILHNTKNFNSLFCLVQNSPKNAHRPNCKLGNFMYLHWPQHLLKFTSSSYLRPCFFLFNNCNAPYPLFMLPVT